MFKHIVLQKIKPFTLAIGWGIFVFGASLTPGNEVPKIFELTNDKLIHAAIYFLQAALIIVGFTRFKKSNTPTKTILLYALGICLFMGGIIEIIQEILIPKRTGDWLDFIANNTGSVMCALIFVIQRKAKAY